MSPSRVDLATLFDLCREPVYVLNPHRRLIYGNRAFWEQTSFDPQQALGLFCVLGGPVEIQPDAGQIGGLGAPDEVFRQAVAAELPWRGPDQNETQPGETVVSFLPLTDRTQAVVAVVAVVCRRSVVPTKKPQEMAGYELLTEVRRRLAREFGTTRFVARSAATWRALRQARLAATNVPAPVLFWGPKGVGKSLLARVTHTLSSRREGAFLVFDCSVFSSDEVAAELWALLNDLSQAPDGPHEARQTAEGAPPRTLFIKHLELLPRDAQRLLLERSDLWPQGDSSSACWIMASTRVDPQELLSQKLLLTEFFHWISVVTIELPPLRERLEDLEPLAQACIEDWNLRHGTTLKGLTPRAWDALRSYDWPGNVGELSSVLEEACRRASAPLIDEEDLPGTIKGAVGDAYAVSDPQQRSLPLEKLLAEAERRLILLALQRTGGNRAAAAQLLELDRARLYRRMAQLGLGEESERP
jgi:DNA-binding NtrC family response regulator